MRSLVVIISAAAGCGHFPTPCGVDCFGAGRQGKIHPEAEPGGALPGMETHQ